MISQIILLNCKAQKNKKVHDVTISWGKGAIIYITKYSSILLRRSIISYINID